MKSEDRLNQAFDSLDADIDNLLARYRKVKADREALLAACKEALALFAKDHAVDRFDWAKSGLRAQDIAELNELPGKLRKAIQSAVSQ